MPALSLPLLQAGNGMPVGVRLAGRVGDDARLLRTALAGRCNQVANKESEDVMKFKTIAGMVGLVAMPGFLAPPMIQPKKIALLVAVLIGAGLAICD
ncbi:MAG: hypothetical protein ACOY9D_03685 [Pseudomonadota bacterium]